MLRYNVLHVRRVNSTLRITRYVRCVHEDEKGDYAMVRGEKLYGEVVRDGREHYFVATACPSRDIRDMGFQNILGQEVSDKLIDERKRAHV